MFGKKYAWYWVIGIIAVAVAYQYLGWYLIPIGLCIGLALVYPYAKKWQAKERAAKLRRMDAEIERLEKEKEARQQVAEKQKRIDGLKTELKGKANG